MINIATVAGLIGINRRFAYCISKGAVIAITKQLAVEYPTQMRVNCITPGTVDLPFVESYLEKYHKHEKAEVRAQLNQRQPIGRLAGEASLKRSRIWCYIWRMRRVSCMAVRRRLMAGGLRLSGPARQARMCETIR